MSLMEAFKAFGSFLLPSLTAKFLPQNSLSYICCCCCCWVFSSRFRSVVWRFASSWHTIWMGQDGETQLPLKKPPWKTFQTLMCNYSVKQQNLGSASFLAAPCFGPKEIHLPGEFRESAPGWARGARHGRKLKDLISRAGLVFLWLSVSICQWIHVLTLTTALEEPAPPGLVAACWWEGRGQDCRHVKCLQGRLEAMQKGNGARFRHL